MKNQLRDYETAKMLKEQWRPYPNYEGLYEVSNRGRVKSLRRKVKHPRGKNVFIKERILKPSTSAGYPAYSLSKNGKTKTHKIHWAIGKLFVTNPNNLPELNHKDGNKMNPISNNLEWTTHSGNMKHAIDTGLMTAPTKRHRKLSDSDIGTIAKLKNKGVSVEEIAKAFEVDRTAIYYHLNKQKS